MFVAQRRYERSLRDSYRAYVTDALNNIPQGRYTTMSWSEAIRPREDIDVEATIERIAAALEA